jgi:threonine synthase
MDILISSNLERLLFYASGCDDQLVASLMDKLRNSGEYKVPDALKSEISRDFEAGYCDDRKTAALIREVFESSRYLCDTHTAVAVRVYRDYRARTNDSHKNGDRLDCEPV